MIIIYIIDTIIDTTILNLSYKITNMGYIKENEIEDDVNHESVSDEEELGKPYKNPLKKPVKKLVEKIVKTSITNSETKYNEYPCDNFKNKLGKYTFGLDKVIPWEDG